MPQPVPPGLHVTPRRWPAHQRLGLAGVGLWCVLGLWGCESWWRMGADDARDRRTSDEAAVAVSRLEPAARQRPAGSPDDADEPSAPCADPVPHDAPLLTDVRTNVLGSRLGSCSTQPLTGFFRDGTCRTDERDRGMHVVCAQVTRAFLDYTRSQGEDLTRPELKTHFPGLRPGDRWCVCAGRWAEAQRAGVAPPVVLGATASKALQIVDRDVLFGAALDAPGEDVTERPAKTATLEP